MSSDKFSKLSWLKRTDKHKFTGSEFRVLVALFNHSGADGTDSHPGLKLLMAETGYRKAAISEALTALQERGWVTQTRKGSGTSGHTSVYALVPDAPRPPSGSAVADQPMTGSGSAGVDLPTDVGLLERTSRSAGADIGGPLEWTPTDPDNRSGSDPFRSDQEEVRYSPNHLEDQDETASFGRSLADEGRTEAPEEHRPVGLQPPVATWSPFDDPFAGAIPERVDSGDPTDPFSSSFVPVHLR